MPDLILSTERLIVYAQARLINRAAGRSFPFDVGYALRILDGNVQTAVEAYNTTLKEIRLSLAEVDAEGRPIIEQNGLAKVAPERQGELSALLRPILDQTITVPFTKFKPEAFGKMELSDAEQDGLAPLIEA